MRQPAKSPATENAEDETARLIDRRPYLLPPVFLALILGLGLLLAPPLPAKEAPRPANAAKAAPAASQPATASAPAGADDTELKERLRSLEDRERQTYAFVLEGQRKTMDWWFSYLAIVTAIIGLGGVFLPFFLAKKEKEDLRQMQKSFREQLDAARTMAGEMRGHHERGKAVADDIEKRSRELANMSIPLAENAGQQAKKEEIQAAAKAIENNEKADFIDRLRAKAIRFTMEKDYARAKVIWQTLVEENSQDAQAHFALGLCLHGEADTIKDTQPDAARARWQQSAEHYRKALDLKPDLHDAANNLGSALDDEACALAPTDLPAARTLWQQATERYRQAELPPKFRLPGEQVG